MSRTSVGRGNRHAASVAVIAASLGLFCSTGLASAQSFPQGRPDYAAQARPQNIFEAMFPGLIQERLRRQRAFNSQPPVDAVPIQKISSPQYYTYKARPLAPIDLAPLATSLPEPADTGVTGAVAQPVSAPPADAAIPASDAGNRVEASAPIVPAPVVTAPTASEPVVAAPGAAQAAQPVSPAVASSDLPPVASPASEAATPAAGNDAVVAKAPEQTPAAASPSAVIAADLPPIDPAADAAADSAAATSEQISDQMVAGTALASGGAAPATSLAEPADGDFPATASSQPTSDRVSPGSEIVAAELPAIGGEGGSRSVASNDSVVTSSELPAIAETPNETAAAAAEATAPGATPVADVGQEAPVETAPVVAASTPVETPSQSAAVVSTPQSRALAYQRVASRFADLAFVAEPEVGKAIAGHYAGKQELIWLDDNLQPNAAARAVHDVLASADRYGLDTADYSVALPDASDGDDNSPTRLDAAARFEISMTARAIRYGLDAALGRVDPNKLSGYHDFPARKLGAEDVLEKLAGQEPAAALVAFQPDNAPFRALVAELERLEGQRDQAIVIPEGTLIKPDQTDPQVPNVIAAIGKRGSEELKAQFAALLASDAPPQTSFTPEVVELVKAFQKEAGLGADGIVGRNTIARLSDLGVETKRQRIVLALERLRWHPRDLGSRHVFINQPAYRARYVENDRTKLDMRVVVGTTAHQTSFFYDTIETVEYNPYWGVPKSILVNEYLPKLRENPAYLDERGYEVTDAKGRRIASSAIDWWSIGSNPPFDVRQSPGEANALGELKILFPNKHAIYMHDTPAKSLFSRDERAFSHGCVRLAEPRQMAAAVLGSSVSHVEEMLTKGHGQDELAHKFPVYVAYFTAWPKDDGAVEYFSDVYSRDQALAKAISAVEAERNVSG